MRSFLSKFLIALLLVIGLAVLYLTNTGILSTEEPYVYELSSELPPANPLVAFVNVNVVPMDSEVQSIEDLSGLTWGIPDFGSTSGYLFPTAMFQAAGVEPGEIVETGGHTNAMLAVHNGEVDFATAFFRSFLDGVAPSNVTRAVTLRLESNGVVLSLSISNFMIFTCT